MDHLAEEIAPNAGHLVESLRDFGYTLQSALADLIDNSLTAGAKTIEVTIHAGRSESHIAVADDGNGMEKSTLVEAMRMGGDGPLGPRRDSDLGRFGLGMKTASLSQGRSLTVITRCDRRHKPLVRRWDIPYIQQSGKWQLLDNPTPIGAGYLEELESKASGTVVLIENLDRPAFLRAGDSLDEHLGRTLESIRDHLSMVFHRFIEDGITLKVGPTKLKPWDPFLKSIATQLPPERLYVRKESVTVTPYVLPHHSRLTDEQHEGAAGPNGWNEHQGFYIYRCRRLIIPGNWLNLNLKKEEHFKLARIQVDLPNSMDSDWHLNVMKSHVAAPAFLREDFKRIAKDVRRQAADVYRVRGERQVSPDATPERFVWRRDSTRAGVRYRIDRTHPLIRALLHGGCEHEQLLERCIQLIESTVPIASMLQEPAKSVDGHAGADSPEDIAGYAAMVAHAEQFLIRAGIAPADARSQVLAAEPFAKLRDAITAYFVKSRPEKNRKEG
jgi:hypothetical protein